MHIRLSLCSLVLLLTGAPINVLAATNTEPASPAAGVEMNVLTTNTASQAKDSIRIYFHEGKSLFDPDLCNNRAVLADYVGRIRKLDSEGRLNDIVIEGYASPDGTAPLNEQLAVERSRILADIIEEQTGIDRAKIKAIPAGINWDELRRLLESHPEAPSRKEAMYIIDNTPIWIFNSKGKIIGGRKKALMDLRGGRPYRWMYANLFPGMRNAVAITLNLNNLSSSSEANTDFEPIDSLTTVSEAYATDTASHVSTDTSNLLHAIDAEAAQSAHAPLHAFALKTNMLYYAALLPNLELEWYVNDKWSVTLEGNIAWWGKSSKNRLYRLAMVSPEVRRWFKRGPLRRGLFVGATAGFGLYDLLKDTPGYRGEGVMGGFTCGYQWPIGRNLSLEALAGVGYVYTNVKEYTPLEGHHVYMRTRAINYFGPIKLEFSIAWRFYDYNKPKHAILERR